MITEKRNELYSSYPENDFRSYLQHHGVKDQKWGVRNGDWYPLDAWKAHLARTGRIEKNGNSGTTHSSNDAKIQINKSTASELKKIRENRTGEIDEKTGFYKRTDKKPIEKDLKNVNPAWDPEAPNTNNNCVNCSLDVEMRRRGYDTYARTQAYPVSGLHVIKKVFPSSEIVNLNEDLSKITKNYYLMDLDDKAILKAKQLATARQNTEHAEKVYNTLSKEGNSRGSLFVLWGPGGGHALNYEVKNGKVKIIDGQLNQVYKDEDIVKLILKGTWSVQYVRTDNQKFDTEQIKKYIA